MLLRSLLLPLLPLALPLSAGTTDPTDELLAPPGLVLIPGGRTQVGSSPKEIEDLITENEPLRTNASSFIGETPKNKVQVDDFYLMVTEVTNEQFAAYVTATQARPPYHWADEALNAAREAFLEEQAQARAAAVAAGERPPASQKFEAAEWWAQNWRGQPWSIPQGLEAMPVVFVDYSDAEGYARWAGLRLMTEEEYQRACRGDGDDPYPWGDKWEHGKYAATQEMGSRGQVLAVGSFPEGATKLGVFDLAGNAWEWTASRYTSFKGFKPFKITIGRGKNKVEIDALPPFNPDQRVVVSGSIQNPRFMARCTTRGGFERWQQAGALGFRCAATPAPGADMAVTLEREVPPELRPKGKDGSIKYDPRLTLAMDRWRTAAEKKGAVEGYEVISGYDYVLFLPVEKIFGVHVKDIREASLEEGLVPIGLFATNQELLEPAISPGTYVVSFRGKGEQEPPPVVEEEDPKDKKKKKKDEAPAPAADQEQQPAEGEEPSGPPLTELIPMDPAIDNFILFDLSGAPVAAIPVEKLDSGMNPQKGSIIAYDKTITKLVGEKEVEEVQKWLAFEVYLPGRLGSKGFLTQIPLRFADGVVEGVWRKQ